MFLARFCDKLASQQSLCWQHVLSCRSARILAYSRFRAKELWDERIRTHCDSHWARSFWDSSRGLPCLLKHIHIFLSVNLISFGYKLASQQSLCWQHVLSCWSARILDYIRFRAKEPWDERIRAHCASFWVRSFGIVV